MFAAIKSELRQLYSTKAQSDNGKRITWIDMARGFAIILVVMGHRGFITANTNTWISSFHLPLFFIATGMLFYIKSENERKAGEFILRKFKGLLIPYFLFSIASIMLDFHFVPAGPERLMPDFKLHLFQTFTLLGYSVLWFLPVTFLAEIIVYFIRKKLKLILMTVVLTIASFASYYGYVLATGNISSSLIVDECISVTGIFNGTVIAFALLRLIIKSIIAATFMSYGMCLSKYVLGNKENNNTNWVMLIIGVVLTAINVIATGFITLKDLNNLDLGFLCVYLILGTTGSVGIFMICKNIFNIPLLTYFGKNSIVVFCTHLNCYVLYYGTIFFLHFDKRGQLPHIVNETITSNVYSMLFTFMLEIPVIFAINIFLPFMLGKWYRRR